MRRPDGEGNRKDVSRRKEPSLDEEPNPLGQDSGLPRSRARDDSHGAGWSFYSASLFIGKDHVA